MGKLQSHKAMKGHRTKRSIGAYGSKRNTQAKSAKQVTRREQRLQNERVQAALAEAKRSDAVLETLVPDPEGPAVGAQYSAMSKAAIGKVEIKSHPTTAWRGDRLMTGDSCPLCGTAFGDCDQKLRTVGKPCCRRCDDVGEEIIHAIKPVGEHHAFEPYEGDPKPGYRISDARKLIQEGYHAAAVIRRTGVGFKWIEDLCGADGYMKSSLVS